MHLTVILCASNIWALRIKEVISGIWEYCSEENIQIVDKENQTQVEKMKLQEIVTFGVHLVFLGRSDG